MSIVELLLYALILMFAGMVFFGLGLGGRRTFTTTDLIGNVALMTIGSAMVVGALVLLLHEVSR